MVVYNIKYYFCIGVIVDTHIGVHLKLYVLASGCIGVCIYGRARLLV